jgi:hypothetical protein
VEPRLAGLLLPFPDSLLDGKGSETLAEAEVTLCASILSFPLLTMYLACYGARAQRCGTTRAGPKLRSVPWGHGSPSAKPIYRCRGIVLRSLLLFAIAFTFYIKGTSIHQKVRCFWIRPRSQLSAEACSPAFVHKQWDSASDIPAPPWLQGRMSWKVRPLQEAVHWAIYYSRKPNNVMIVSP